MVFKRPLGKMPARFALFYCPYDDVQVERCPNCGVLTELDKVPLVLDLENDLTRMVLRHLCRHCPLCDMLIVGVRDLHEHVDSILGAAGPEDVDNEPLWLGSDFEVIGTVERVDWWRIGPTGKWPQDLSDVMHEFKDCILFVLDDEPWRS